VPYKGSTAGVTDLMSGEIQLIFSGLTGMIPHHKANRVRGIAVTSGKRNKAVPDLPTVGETVPGFEFHSWYGLWGPAKLPKDIAQRLNTEVNKALATDDMRNKLIPQGLLLTPGSIEDFARFQKDDMARSARIIAEGGIRAE